MSALITAVAASTALGAYSSYQSGRAAQRAAGVQADAAMAGVDLHREQFERMQELLGPFARGGTASFEQQLDMLGVNGPEKQAAALQSLQDSPQFTESLRLGEESILQNASATGGLRGGNTQSALMRFRPQLLNSLFADRFGQLGGLASIGQNAAAGVGNAGQTMANNVGNLLGQAGSATAGGILGRQAGMNGMFNALAQGAGMFAGYGRFGGFGGNGRYNGWSGNNAWAPTGPE